VIRYEKGTKNPGFKGWPEAQLSLEQAANVPDGANLGILMADGLVDADMDWGSSVRLGRKRLPQTPFHCGRVSTPQAHSFFRSDLLRTIYFDDPTMSNASGERARIAELRTAGRGRAVQTLVYGHHPCGEGVGFEGAVELNQLPFVSAEELRACIAQIASACLIAKHIEQAWDSSRAHAVMAMLCSVTDRGIAIRIMEDIEELLSGNCATDWAQVDVQGATDQEFRLDKRIVSCLSEWLNPAPSEKKGKKEKSKKSTSLKPVIIPLAEVQPRTVDWFWRGYIPRGKLSALVGDPGVSKSTLTIDLAARFTTGRAMPMSDESSEPGYAVFICAEDDEATTIVPRLIAADADLTRCVSVPAVTTADGNEILLNLDSHITAIEQAIVGKSRVFVVIDPVNAFLGPKRKSHIDQDFRQVLTPLSKLAGRTGTTIVLVTHFNRQETASAISKVAGSTGLIGSVRSGLMVANHPDRQKPDCRVLAPIKQNLARLGKSIEYEIYETETSAALRWIGYCDYSANDLVQPPPTRETRNALHDAQDFLKTVLADGARPSAEVEALAKRHGHSPATIRRAREGLVDSYRDGREGCWYMVLEGDTRTRLNDKFRELSGWKAPTDSAEYAQ
jgi:putative DNA primase/helicase